MTNKVNELAQNAKPMTMDALQSLYTSSVVPDLRPGRDWGKEAEIYRLMLLSFIETRSPSFSQHFPSATDGAADPNHQIAILPTSPTIIRNLQVLHNVLVQFRDIFPLLKSEGYYDKAKLAAKASAMLSTLTQFDTKKSEEFTSFLQFMRSIMTNGVGAPIEQAMPELHQFVTSSHALLGSKVSAPLEATFDRLGALFAAQDTPAERNNKALFEQVAIAINPDFADHANDKGALGSYNLSDEQDTHTIRLIKTLINTIDLHAKVLMQHKNDNNYFQVAMQMVAGAAMLKEQVESISILPAVKDQAGRLTNLIRDTLRTALAPSKELAKLVDLVEENTYSPHGSLYDMAMAPWLPALLQKLDDAGAELTDDEQNCFANARQQAIHQRYVSLNQKGQINATLQSRTQRLADLLDRNTALGEFTSEELAFVQDNLHLLPLPSELADTLSQALEHATVIVEDEYYQNSWMTSLVNLVDRWHNLIGDDELGQQAAAEIAVKFARDVAIDCHDVALSIDVMGDRPAELLPEQIDRFAEVSNTQLAERAQAVLEKNFELRNLVRAAHASTLYAVEHYCAKPIAEQILRAKQGNYFGVYPNQSADVRHIVILLNTLQKADEMLSGDTGDSYGILGELYQLTAILSNLKLEAAAYGDKSTLVNTLIFGTYSDASGLYNRLLGSVKTLLMLKPDQVVEANVDVDAGLVDAVELDQADHAVQADDVAEVPVEAKVQQSVVRWIRSLATDEPEVDDDVQAAEAEAAEAEEAPKDSFQATMELVEEKILGFINNTFHEDVTSQFVPDATTGFYPHKKDENKVVCDLKHIMNAAHYLTQFAQSRAEGDTVFVWLSKVNHVTYTLGQVDLAAAHPSVKVLYNKVLGLFKDVSDEFFRDTLSRTDQVEALGLEYGVMADKVQYTIEQAQVHLSMIGVQYAETEQHAYADERIAARQSLIEHLAQMKAQIQAQMPTVSHLHDVVLEAQETGLTKAHSQEILAHLDMLGFSDLETKTYEVCLRAVKSMTSAEQAQLFNRIKACYATANDKIIEADYRATILTYHQEIAQTRHENDRRVATSCIAVTDCVKAAQTALLADNIDLYNVWLEMAISTQAMAKEMADVSGSVLSANRVTAVSAEISTLKKAYQSHIVAKLDHAKPAEKPVESVSFMSMMFDTPPANFMEFMVRLVDALVALFQQFLYGLMNQQDQPAKAMISSNHLLAKSASEDKAQNPNHDEVQPIVEPTIDRPNSPH